MLGGCPGQTRASLRRTTKARRALAGRVRPRLPLSRQHITLHRALHSLTSVPLTKLRLPIPSPPRTQRRLPPCLPCVAEHPWKAAHSAISPRAAKYTIAFPQYALRRHQQICGHTRKFLLQAGISDTWPPPLTSRNALHPRRAARRANAYPHSTSTPSTRSHHHGSNP